MHCITKIWVAAFGLLLIFVSTGCSDNQEPEFRYHGSTMGTTFSVVALKLPDTTSASALKQEIDEALEQVNALMSTYREESQLSRFNQSTSTDWFDVSPRVAAVVQQAKEISEATNGAYDVTIGPLVNLWGFGPEMRVQHAPTQAEIDAARKATGVEALAVRQDPGGLKKDHSDIYVDLSSIAKGYGVDWLAEIFDAYGVQDYLVEVGGELRASGKNSRGLAWQIAIEKPLPGERSVQEIVSLQNAALATSGDYRNYFEEEGQRFSHTIDARTGYPIKHRLASVSVLSHTAMKADAIATALMVLGPDAGYDVATENGWAAYFIYREGDRFVAKATAGFPTTAE